MFCAHEIVLKWKKIIRWKSNRICKSCWTVKRKIQQAFIPKWMTAAVVAINRWHPIDKWNRCKPPYSNHTQIAFISSSDDFQVCNQLSNISVEHKQINVSTTGWWNYFFFINMSTSIIFFIIWLLLDLVLGNIKINWKTIRAQKRSIHNMGLAKDDPISERASMISKKNGRTSAH